VPAIVSVFALAVVELWFAIPAGLALGLDPLVVWLCTVAGALLGVALVATGGDAVRQWFLRRRGREIVAGRGRVVRLWQRYGVIGWGLLSPLVVAAPMGTAIGLALGAPKRRLLLSMCCGVALWTTIVVLAGALGFQALHLFA